MTSPRYVVEKRIHEMIRDLKVGEEVTSRSLVEKYVGIYGAISAPNTRQMGRLLGLSGLFYAEERVLKGGASRVWVRNEHA
tara:strand:- start:103 stop:345 length:243 start_codon:yes stop_codon:yes gene_type:complete